MLHGSLTLLMRSIRDDALQQHSHLLRLMSVMILLTMFLVAVGQPHAGGAPGLVFFQQLAYLGMALITLAGIGHFSSSITEEKEEGTLGLLLLANLSPLAVLLGKSTNRVFSALLLLLTLFPFSLLSLTLGGITSLQIVAVFLALGAYLFLMANLALLVSVLVRRSTEAIVVMTLLVLVMHGAPETLYNSVQLLERHHQPAAHESAVASFIKEFYGVHQQVSVIHEIRRIFDTSQDFTLLTWQVPVSLLAGAILFTLAVWRFSLIVWAPDVTEPIQPRSINQSNRWVHVVSRPWAAAIVWKDFHFISGGPALLLCKCLIYPAWIWLCLANGESIKNLFDLPAFLFLQFSLAIFFVAELFVSSSQLFQIERRNGTLSTLLMIPQSLSWISTQKVLGCLIGSLPTLLALLILIRISPEGYGTAWVVGTGMKMDFLLGLLILGCAVFVICQLTVLCSLIVNWGALPLAIALMLIVSGVCGPLLSGVLYVMREQHQPEYAQFGPVIYLTGLISIVLQFEILRRLELLSGK